VSAASDWRATLVAHWQRSTPSALSRALQPLSWLYRLAAGIDRGLYDSRLRTRARAPRPLIVVGNLVAGGAGKTPTVIALVELLRRLGRRPGIVSRGYGRVGTGVQIVRDDSPVERVGDEPLLLRLRTRAPVAVSARRIEAARVLCADDPSIDVLIADDGLQHHALERDLQVIVFDARGAGNGLLLPAGPLREPLPPQPPARSLVLYSEGLRSTALAGWCATRRLSGVLDLAAWWRGEPAGLATLHALRGRTVYACAGTARPERFFEMLEQQGLALHRIALPDHAGLHTLPWPADAADVVVTEKDAVKLGPGRTGRTRVWVAPLDFTFEPDFVTALAALLPPWKPTP